MSSAFIPREKIRDTRPWSPETFVERRRGDRRGNGEPAANAATDGRPAGGNDEPQAPPAPPPIDLEAEKAKLIAERATIAREREATLDAAREEGFLAGLADGRKSARAEVARLTRIVDAFDSALAASHEQVAESLVSLAIDVARAVVRRELRADPAILMAVVEEALRSLPETVNAGQIAVHPDDATLVRERLDVLNSEGRWEVVPQPGIEAGGCRVVTRACEVDGTLQTRWRRALQSFGRSEADHPLEVTADE